TCCAACRATAAGILLAEHRVEITLRLLSQLVPCTPADQQRQRHQAGAGHHAQTPESRERPESADSAEPPSQSHNPVAAMQSAPEIPRATPVHCEIFPRCTASSMAAAPEYSRGRRC